MYIYKSTPQQLGTVRASVPKQYARNRENVCKSSLSLFLYLCHCNAMRCEGDSFFSFTLHPALALPKPSPAPLFVHCATDATEEKKCRCNPSGRKNPQPSAERTIATAEGHTNTQLQCARINKRCCGAASFAGCISIPSWVCLLCVCVFSSSSLSSSYAHCGGSWSVGFHAFALEKRLDFLGDRRFKLSKSVVQKC